MTRIALDRLFSALFDCSCIVDPSPLTAWDEFRTKLTATLARTRLRWPAMDSDRYNDAVAQMPTRKIERGHYFEDFEVGQVFEHHWGRTINEGDNSLFTSVTMNFNPLYFNREYARELGHRDVVVNHMLVLNVVFGLSVEDLSERAIAHLGYEQLKFGAIVYPGDTLRSRSEVLSKRDTSRPDRGVVKFRTTGINQRGETVLQYERPVLVRKRAALAS